MTDNIHYNVSFASVVFMKRPYLSKFIFIPVLMLISLPGLSKETAETYLFGVFPHVPKSKLYDMYSPVAKDFQQKLQRKVSVYTKKFICRV